MFAYAPPLARLISELTKLPTIGPKTAQRLAFHILTMNQHDVEALAAHPRGQDPDPAVLRVREHHGGGSLRHLHGPAAGPVGDLRRGAAPGRGGHGARAGVQRTLPRVAGRHFPPRWSRA